jgi:hypothetical protein
VHLPLPIMDTGTRPVLDPKKDSAFDPECENTPSSAHLVKYIQAVSQGWVGCGLPLKVGSMHNNCDGNVSIVFKSTRELECNSDVGSYVKLYRKVRRGRKQTIFAATPLLSSIFYPTWIHFRGMVVALGMLVVEWVDRRRMEVMTWTRPAALRKVGAVMVP